MQKSLSKFICLVLMAFLSNCGGGGSGGSDGNNPPSNGSIVGKWLAVSYTVDDCSTVCPGHSQCNPGSAFDTVFCGTRVIQFNADGTVFLTDSDLDAMQAKTSFGTYTIQGNTLKTTPDPSTGYSEETFLVDVTNSSLTMKFEESGANAIAEHDRITQNIPPVVQIVYPNNDSVYSTNDIVNFSAMGIDPETGYLSGASLVWASDLDGLIGTGNTCNSNTLSVGTHHITLTGTDSEGVLGVDNLTITVNSIGSNNSPPVAQISSPINGAIYTRGDAIQFSGSGSDTEDGTLSGSSLVWVSDVDGQIGTGETFSSSNLSAGPHQITILVTDSQGVVATKTISISILSGGSSTWTRVYGAEDDGEIYSVQQSNDGGFIFAGQITTATNGIDVWLFKTDNEGNQIWSRTFGGTGSDWALSVQQTTDGGYIIAGSTTSSGSGGFDILLLKTNSTGNEVWSRTFGGSGEDHADSVVQSSDGGYIIAGGTTSFGSGGSDFWLIKTDSLGNEAWNNTYGGIDSERAKSVQQTNDGGYILAGYTGSYGAGAYDGFVVKTDPSGKETWNKAFGTSDGEYLYSVIQANDGNYLLAGQQLLSADMSGHGWLIKANSAGDVLWEKVYSLGDYEEVRSVQQATDGGYVLAGNTDANSDEDGWVIKVDGDGNIVWMKTYGSDNSHDALDDIKTTNDGGYILAGTQSNIATHERNGLAIKIDGSGNY